MTVATKTVVTFNPATEAAEAKRFKEEHPGWKEDITSAALAYTHSEWQIFYPKEGSNESAMDNLDSQ